MKKLITILLCLLTTVAYSQKGKNNAPNFNIGDFQYKSEIAEWLFQYDLVAWWTSDSVMVQDKREIERLGKEWFCYQDESKNWHAVYGKFSDGNFSQVFHFTVDSTANVKRTNDQVDSALANSYSRALSIAGQRVEHALGDSINIKFNQFIRRNDDQTISVWMLPAFQQDYTAVYGVEFIYTINSLGDTVLKDNSYYKGKPRGFKVDKPREIWLNYGDVEAPTLGSIFFVLYYRKYFTSIYIDCQNSTTTFFKDADGRYTWIHAAKEPQKKKRK